MSVTAKAPWKDYLGEIPFTLDYFQGSMYDKFCHVANSYPHNVALDFMHKSTTYAVLKAKVDTCANALHNLGIKDGDSVTIAMPNCPQAIAMFYAVNKIGALANMVHPLSSQAELQFYLNESNSSVVVTLDQFYGKISAIKANTSLKHIIVASIKDELGLITKIGYDLTAGRKIAKVPQDDQVVLWKDFVATGKVSANCKANKSNDDPAVILYSGGTTGTTKGIVLTNGNFNALSQQVIATNPMFRVGDKMLAAMPIFHGFGLGVCIHTMLTEGGRCILVPRFNAKSYSKLITKYKCNFIAGVPTLYEAILRLPSMSNANLSCLKGVFSGGDSLTIELKKKFDAFLKEHKATIQIREGYGTTECVTACCLTPPTTYKEGSIGLPFPDTYFKIVEPNTDKEVPYGTEGEILLAGPTVMKEYWHHEEETANTLRKHGDGLTWVYTGDLGLMDEQGFVYFKGRIKRMIVTSGYNVYPAQIENILEAHPAVHRSCVIGVPDSYKMHKVKAFVMLRDGFAPTDETKQSILEHCKKNIAKYAMPYDVEFRESLPTTLVGKVAYRQLEEEELAKLDKE